MEWYIDFCKINFVYILILLTLDKYMKHSLYIIFHRQSFAYKDIKS